MIPRWEDRENGVEVKNDHIRGNTLNRLVDALFIAPSGF